jgi:hypothetical protein
VRVVFDGEVGGVAPYHRAGARGCAEKDQERPDTLAGCDRPALPEKRDGDEDCDKGEVDELGQVVEPLALAEQAVRPEAECQVGQQRQEP